LIGHSIGADTAAVTADKYPGLVKGVILEDPPWPNDYFGRRMRNGAPKPLR
jgi:pimeloyl-ACP methyl ester carboxylesterase